MITAAIVQARMGSTRLPGKSAMLLAGKPLLWHVLDRVKKSTVDFVALAVPKEKDTAALIEIAEDSQVPIFIVDGDPNDLLFRYSEVADCLTADPVVRIPADNPCVDPDEINRIITFYLQNVPSRCLFSNLDRNIAGNGYPGGLGAEVYSRDFLEWLNQNVKDPRLREHPHLWAFEKQKVRTCPCPVEFARPDLRFDVNTQEDFDFIRGIYEALGSDCRIKGIIEWLDKTTGYQKYTTEARPLPLRV